MTKDKLRQIIKEEIESQNSVDFSSAPSLKWEYKYALSIKMKCDIKYPHATHVVMDSRKKNILFKMEIATSADGKGSVTLKDATGNTLDQKTFITFADTIDFAKKTMKKKAIGLVINKYDFDF